MRVRNEKWHMIKRVMRAIGIDPRETAKLIGNWSIRAAIKEQGLGATVQQLKKIVPDISQQESRPYENTPFMEIKRRSLQAAQCHLMLEQISGMNSATVIDIGDSAGTHMLYLKALAGDHSNLETISVNLDDRAIEKIRARGLRAIQCRAEELTNCGIGTAALMTSFEMVEHLHNPALFFHRLAVRGPCSRMVISVPFLHHSRVGFHHIRQEFDDPQFAEDVHVFELSPEDWSLLLQHSGWRVVKSMVYYQYPQRIPLISWMLRIFWRNYDFEGFWCAVLEKDLTWSDLYRDWEE